MNTYSTERMPWEEFDADLEQNTVAVSQEEAKAIDEDLGLQMISIRLQRSLLGKLKLIAEFRGVGYQPLIRDLLNRFARSEIQAILSEIKEKESEMQRLVAEARESPAPAMQPVSDFFERERERKCA